MYSDEEEGRVGGWVEERKERKVQPSTQEENSRFPYASFSYLYLVVFHLDTPIIFPSLVFLINKKADHCSKNKRMFP